jgi:hypothetical protein
MMVGARKMSEDEVRVIYEFGLDERFDRVLVIAKPEWRASTKDARFDSAAGAIAAKIKRAWAETGEFPPFALFAS